MFNHLHLHTEKSLLDGAIRPDDLVKKIKSHGGSAVACTDHGSLAAIPQVISQCKSAGIKPICGIEFYVAPFSHTEKTLGGGNGKESSFHLTVLAKNGKGLKNLVKLSSIAFTEGFYRKPRISKELLAQYSDGLILLTGCASSELSDLLLYDKWEEAEKLAAWYHRNFGNDMFMEIQRNSVSIQEECLQKTVKLADKMGLPLVVTSDCHFLEKDQFHNHQAMLCINSRDVLSNPNRFKFDSDDFYVQSPEEMYARFDPKFHEAIARTCKIADSVEENYESFEFGKRRFPSFDVPDQKTADQFLRELCEEGARSRYQNPGPEVWDRLDMELGVISRTGFTSYFLMLWDVARFCRESDITMNVRGSAAGAIVSYCLYLSHVCPLRFNLIFQRLLSEERAAPPDIDCDLDQERREEVIQYVRDKYGADHVAQICTYGTLGPKMAIKDVARVLGMPLWRADELSKLVPHGLHTTIEETMAVPIVAKMIQEDRQVAELFEIAKFVEGKSRSAGTHAAGVVVTPVPVSDIVPLMRIGDKEKGKGKTAVVTQWTMGDIEASGCLKMDFLGLRSLTSLYKCIRLIKNRHGVEIDWRHLPMDDVKTFELLQRGETRGVFQLESAGITDVVVKMKPDRIDDIIATCALYRPAAIEAGAVDSYIRRKHGLEEIESVHPSVDKYLERSYGLQIYQESVMYTLHYLADIPLVDAYAVIKAISKKQSDKIAKYRDAFIKGAMSKGLEQTKCERLFHVIELQSGYSFNLSHSAAYGYVSYVTAYLKANYTLEFMCSLLSSEMDGAERDKLLVAHIGDCVRMGIQVLPPDVNCSQTDFSIEGDSLRYGLLAIKGLGQVPAKELCSGRSRGLYAALTQIYERCPSLTKTGVEALIRSGTLDSLGHHRSQWLSTLQVCAKEGQKIAKDARSGQTSMFELLDDIPEVSLPDIPEIPEAEMLVGEKETLGIYVSNHPLNLHSEILDALGTHELQDVQELPEKSEVVIGAMIAGIRLTDTKRNEGLTRMAILTLENKVGLGPAVVFPEAYDRIGRNLKPDGIYFFKGKTDRRRDPAQLIVNDIVPIEDAAKIAKGLLWQFAGSNGIPDAMKAVKPQEDGLPLYLEVLGSNPRTVYKTRYRIGVDSIRDLAKLAKVKVLGTKGGGIRPEMKCYPEDFLEGSGVSD